MSRAHDPYHAPNRMANTYWPQIDEYDTKLGTVSRHPRQTCTKPLFMGYRDLTGCVQWMSLPQVHTAVER